MSVRFDASADRYSRASTGLESSNYTMAAWMRILSDRNTYQMAISVDNAASSFVQMGTDVDGTTMKAFGGGSAGISPAVAMTIGAWYFIAIVNNGTSDMLYWALERGPLTAVGPVDGLPVVAASTTLYIGSSGFADWVDGEIAFAKLWTAVLTQAEVDAERFSYTALRTTNLWGAYNFRDGPRTTDDSGNARTLTAAGTLTAGATNPQIGSSNFFALIGAG